MIRLSIMLLVACAQTNEVYTCTEESTCEGIAVTGAPWPVCGTHSSVSSFLELDVGLCAGALSERCLDYSCRVTCHPTGETCGEAGR